MRFLKGDFDELNFTLKIRAVRAPGPEGGGEISKEWPPQKTLKEFLGAAP